MIRCLDPAHLIVYATEHFTIQCLKSEQVWTLDTLYLFVLQTVQIELSRLDPTPLPKYLDVNLDREPRKIYL